MIDTGRSQAQCNRLASGTGCRGMYCLAQKNPKFDQVHQTMPDAMHTIAVQVKHLVKCIAGKAPEVSVGVRMQEKSLGMFQESWHKVSASEGNSKRRRRKGKSQKNKKDESKSLPPAPFGLTKKQIEAAGKRARDIIAPAGDSFLLGHIFSRISRLNTHEWKMVCFHCCNKNSSLW